MPRSLVHALIWSHEHQHYQLSSEGLPEQGFPPEDGPAFARWLDEHTAFAFVGQSGRISVLKEARRGGIGYWYAYRTQHRHTRKRYLGRTAQVTLARLEEVAKELTSEPSPLLLVSEPAAPPEQREVLLSSKLAPPRLPLSLVERARLINELDAVHTHPLTLVSASPGSGKTTLLSAWVEAHRQSERRRAAGPEPAVAWLSLETLDNDSIRFWSSIIAAVQTCLPRVGKAALAMLHQPSTPPLSTLLTLLLHEIGEARKELILVLDDYHVITDQVIHESLLFLLNHLPPTLHLVLISRTDPELPLARLRVRGQMAEIRSDDLRMTLAEAAHFLVQRMGLPLSEADVTALHQRTEGWIAGLHLAALSLRKQQDIPGWIADFAGSSRYLLDYVQQDILAGLPGPLQHFLLQTSILTRMNATVCQAIMAGSSAAMCQEMLEEVERANLFVVSLDKQRQWYRYHDLFREALLSALHTTQSELVPLLHRRAVDFYEAQGQWHEAITHAFAAADFSAAARLMEQTVEQFWIHGEAETMAHWMQALPERLVREHASLLLTTALYLLHTATTTTGEQRERVHIEVQQLIARVETTLQRERGETSRQLSAPQAGTVSLPTDLNALRASEALLQRRLRLLRMQMTLTEAAITGELERFRSRQQEIEEELDRDEEITWQMVPLSCGFILYYTVRLEGALFVPRLLEARERASRSGSPFAIIKVRQWLVLAAFEAGRLHLASEESQAALDLIERMAGFAQLKGYFELSLAQVWYQWNRLEEARGRLRTIIQDAARWQHGDLLLGGYIDLMLVELARGELSAVQQVIQEFEQLEAYQLYLHWWSQLPPVQAALWLAQGQVKKASDWAASVVFPQGAWDGSLYNAFPVVIRVFFAEHRFREAASLLERWHAHLDRPTNIRITLTYLAQSLVALHQVGKLDQARVVAARLLALTGPEGYVRVYLDEGGLMRQALEALLATADAGNRDTPSKDGKSRNAGSFSRSYVLRLLAVFKQEEQARASFVDQPKVPPESRALVGAQGGSEPLSRQELRVLQHLVAGQTYAEMAEALIVSVNTIKTQVSSIYRKLGVSRRAEAIAKTAQLHLLSPLDHV